MPDALSILRGVPQSKRNKMNRWDGCIYAMHRSSSGQPSGRLGWEPQRDNSRSRPRTLCPHISSSPPCPVSAIPASGLGLSGIDGRGVLEKAHMYINTIRNTSHIVGTYDNPALVYVTEFLFLINCVFPYILLRFWRN